VLEEVPVAMLFGPHGEKVCAIIDAAAALTLDQATRLAAARNPHAPLAQTRAWRKVLGKPSASEHDESMDGVLAAGDSKPPIGQALLVIQGELGRRSEAVVGKEVWAADPDDDERVYLAEPWATAGLALSDAAWAFGAPDHHAPHDRDALAQAWLKTMGAAP
jgi:hypothetical protein